MDGDDTLEYGKAQYTEADIIPCSGAGEDQGEAREREALRGAVLKYDPPPPQKRAHSHIGAMLTSLLTQPVCVCVAAAASPPTE